MAEYSALNGLICVAIAQDRRDPYLAGHSRRVTCDALEIGRELNLTSNILRSLVRAGLLHDIGKIAVPDRVLIKNDKLNEEEMRLMKQHPFVAAEIVESLKDPNLVDFVMFHHEWYDGSGSYYGKKGEDIPIGARILSVADSYDAMTFNRAYRKAMPFEDAISELIRNKGKQFDPNIVDIFVEKKII